MTLKKLDDSFTIEQALALIYNQSPKASLAIAELCDEVLDRTGALLGRVRDIVYPDPPKKINKNGT